MAADHAARSHCASRSHSELLDFHTWLGADAPSVGAHPVHGPEDESNPQANGQPCGVVLGGAPVAVQVLE